MTVSRCVACFMSPWGWFGSFGKSIDLVTYYGTAWAIPYMCYNVYMVQMAFQKLRWAFCVLIPKFRPKITDYVWHCIAPSWRLLETMIILRCVKGSEYYRLSLV